MAIQFVGGQILFVGGAIAMDAACCCGDEPATECPGISNSCPATITLTIAGMDDITSVCDSPTDINGTYTLTKSGDYYSVSFGACFSFELRCDLVGSDVIWSLQFYTTGLCFTVAFGAATGSGCPPLTGASATVLISTYTGGGGCLTSTNGTATLSLPP